MAFKTQNLFGFGIVGDRLDALRNSDIYKQAAYQIDNMIITDVGSLRIAKQYESSNLFSNELSIKSIKSTSNGYYLVLNTSELLTVDDFTNVIKSRIQHGMTENVNMSLISNDKIVLYDGTSKFRSFSINVDDISEDIETFKKVKYPVKKREILQLDLWKISKNPYWTGDPDKDPPGTNKLRAVQMSAFSDPLLKFDTESKQIMLHNSNISINRIYTSYNAQLDIEYFTNPNENDIYGIMRTFPVIEEEKDFILDNRIILTGSETEDTKYKGKYFTTMEFADGKGGMSEGIFTFGRVVPEIEYPEHVSFYQDRMFIYKDNYFYVSKIGQYNDFRNDTHSDSPFYFQLNPISGRSGKMLNTIADIGLFIITTAGIYIVGYGGGQLSPTTFGSSIIIASDATATREHCVKDNILYFLNRQGVLKAVFVDRLSQQLAFNTHTVDKYTNKKLYSGVTKMTIDDREYVVCRSVDNKYIYLFEPADDSIFRKVRIELDTSKYKTLIGSEEYLFADGDIFMPTHKNYKQAVLKLLKPDAASYNTNGYPVNGTQLFDNSTTVNDIIVKMLNEDREGIEGIYINDRPVSNLGSTVPDNFSVYRVKTAVRSIVGPEIIINTNENDKAVELQCVEIGLEAVKDK